MHLVVKIHIRGGGGLFSLEEGGMISYEKLHFYDGMRHVK